MSNAFTRRQWLGGLGVASVASTIGCGGASAGAGAGAGAGPTSHPASIRPEPPTGDVRDFDFMVGAWVGANRRLTKRWVGSTDWEEFVGHLRCEARLDGLVNFTQTEFDTKGWKGLTVRTFDLAQRRWSMYWISDKTGVMLPPLIGGFDGERGLFYGDDVDDGQPIAVRYVWTRPGPGRARWEQAYSRDGVDWEINWIAELTRVASAGD